MICPQCGTLNENVSDNCKRCRKPLHPAQMKGKIACVVHANREATTSCAQCGSRLCPTCAINVGGIDFCENCAPADAVPREHDEDYERIPVLDPARAENSPFGRRLFALAIDWGLFIVPAIIVGVVVLAFGGPFEMFFSAAAGGAAFYVYWAFFLTAGLVYAGVQIAMSGQTVGKRVAGVIVLAPDGHILTWDVAAKRAAAAVLSALPFGLGFLWALWDKNGETWHDKLAGTRSFRWDEVA